MPETLTFAQLYNYPLNEVGITVVARLRHGPDAVEVIAKIDTGATHCIFERRHGENLGLDIESGHKENFGTAIGGFIAYGHELTFTVLGIEIEAMVYFVAHEGFGRNVLGQFGWLNRVRLGLVDVEGKLYLSSNEDEF
jgi:predicted aspartyl protease